MPTPDSASARDDAGAAVVDFVLVSVLLIPLFLGIVQVGLVLHVRNTLVAAAGDGARYAARADRTTTDGAARTRTRIDQALSSRYADKVSARAASVGGAPGVEVTVVATVPTLGLWGPAITLRAQGHAVEEIAP